LARASSIWLAETRGLVMKALAACSGAVRSWWLRRWRRPAATPAAPTWREAPGWRERMLTDAELADDRRARAPAPRLDFWTRRRAERHRW
jgi:hypothetical protein